MINKSSTLNSKSVVSAGVNNWPFSYWRVNTWSIVIRRNAIMAWIMYKLSIVSPVSLYVKLENLPSKHVFVIPIFNVHRHRHKVRLPEAYWNGKSWAQLLIFQAKLSLKATLCFRLFICGINVVMFPVNGYPQTIHFCQHWLSGSVPTAYVPEK